MRIFEIEQRFGVEFDPDTGRAVVIASDEEEAIGFMPAPPRPVVDYQVEEIGLSDELEPRLVLYSEEIDPDEE